MDNSHVLDNPETPHTGQQCIGSKIRTHLGTNTEGVPSTKVVNVVVTGSNRIHSKAFPKVKIRPSDE
jgi:hypothetical protein